MSITIKVQSSSG